MQVQVAAPAAAKLTGITASQSNQEPESTMSSNGERIKEPMIRFGGEWIPAHDAWKKMQSATVVVEHIKRFNEAFPHLASPGTLEVVPLVQRRLRDIELQMPGKVEPPDLGAIANNLLDHLSPEKALEALAEQHGTRIGMEQLITMVGERAYLSCLRREGVEYKMNRISSDQTAQLWNENGRPAPGGGLWSAQKVRSLLAQSPD